MQVLKQQLLHSGIAPTLLDGWEHHQKQYDGKPILWPRLLNEAMELIPLETDAWNAIQNLYSKIMGDQQYIRLLWHLHVLLADSEFAHISAQEWTTLQNFLGSDFDCFGVVLIISWLPTMRQIYSRLGIDDDTIYTTLSDVGIWMQDYKRKSGRWGVDEMGWLSLHVTGKIFRLGRLQFIPGICPWNILTYTDGNSTLVLSGEGEKIRMDGQIDGTNGIFDPKSWQSSLYEDELSITGNPISPMGYTQRRRISIDKRIWSLVCAKGTPVIEIHIPADGRLDMNECGYSFQMASVFFKKHFPEHNGQVFLLCTWFLDAQLDGLLSSKTNIVQFQRQFYLFPVLSSEHACYSRVFGRRTIDDITSMPSDTSLRRAIIEFVSSGNHMRYNAGIILHKDVGTWGNRYYQMNSSLLLENWPDTHQL